MYDFVLAQVTIKANYDDNHKVANYKSQLILNCNIEGSPDTKYIWKWWVYTVWMLIIFFFIIKIILFYQTFFQV